MAFPLATHLVPPRRATARPAFTISELIVTIGVMLVLVSLLFPVLAGARQFAVQSSCANKLRQIHVGAMSVESQERKTLARDNHIQAVGWMSKTYPHLGKNLEAYQCPETDTKVALDSAGTWTLGGTTGTPGGAGPPNFVDAYVHIDAGGGVTWDVPLVEGPWMIKKNATGNSYELWLEDQGFKGGGDKDFKDVAIRVTDNGDGTTTITAIPLTKGKPGYASSVYANTGGSPVLLFKDPYNGDGTPKPGTTATVAGTPPGMGDSSQYGKFNPGAAVAADYGFNDQSNKVNSLAEKVLAMDYTWSVIQTGSDNWNDAKWRDTHDPNRLAFARHRGSANVLYGDGSVRGERASPQYLNPFFGTNRADLWQVP